MDSAARIAKPRRDWIMKKAMTLALFLSIAALLSAVPDADARGKRGDDPRRPPQCQVEDRGIVICR
jgi:hypothetical protein